MSFLMTGFKLLGLVAPFPSFNVDVIQLKCVSVCIQFRAPPFSVHVCDIHMNPNLKHVQRSVTSSFFFFTLIPVGNQFH